MSKKKVTIALSDAAYSFVSENYTVRRKGLYISRLIEKDMKKHGYQASGKPKDERLLDLASAVKKNDSPVVDEQKEDVSGKKASSYHGDSEKSDRAKINSYHSDSDKNGSGLSQTIEDGELNDHRNSNQFLSMVDMF